MIYEHHWHDHKAVYYHDADGFFKVTIFDEGNVKVACLYDLVVYPESRGKGHGRFFMANAINIARQEDCAVMILWADCEPWAEEWYHRVGFQNDPEIIDGYGQTGMSLKLK